MSTQNSKSLGAQGVVSIQRCCLTSIEVRWPYDCLIFNGNPDTSKGHLYITTGPCLQVCFLFARVIQSFYTTLCIGWKIKCDDWICFISFLRLLGVHLVIRQSCYFNLYSWVKILLYILISVFTVKTFPHNFYPILLFPGVSFLRLQSNRSMIKICNRMAWQWVETPVEIRGALADTVGTPYNTAPYITGSNIARLGDGSQNSWSKLWIPIVKSAPMRVIFTWKSVPKKSIHGSSDIYWGTQWKQRHDSPWSYRSDVIVTFLWYGTIGIIWHRDHQSTAKKV